VGKFEGKVAFITGGARGQGRNHALTLAAEGADIVLYDVPDATDTISYPMASVEELKQTEADVTALGRCCLAIEGDVRSYPDVSAAVDRAIEELGGVDIMLANAGAASYYKSSVMPVEAWDELIDINLNGVFYPIRAVLAHMIERGSGRIVATASTMARMGGANAAHYAASKWAVVGLIKSVAMEASKHGVTANCVAPTAVNTPLILNDANFRLFCPDIENPTWEDAEPRYRAMIPMGIPHIEVADVTNAVLYLCSEESRYVTGTVLEVTAGKSAMWSS